MATPVSPIAKAVRHLETGDWQGAHLIVQKDTSTLGCWAHGIVHLIEGDLANARYWYRRAHRSLQDANTVIAEIAALRHSLEQGIATRHSLQEEPFDSQATRPPASSKSSAKKGTQ